MSNFHCKKPCDNCPFRKDLPPHFKGWLSHRITEIVGDCVNGDTPFICHKTSNTANEMLCAGAIILDNKNNNGHGFSNRVHRFVEFDKIKGGELIFDSVQDCLEFHEAKE